MKSKNLNQLVSNEVTQKLIFIFFMKIFLNQIIGYKNTSSKRYKYSKNQCHHFK